MPELDSLTIKIFADGADLASIKALCRNPLIRGFTTNPTLMRKTGVADFTAFAREAVEIVGERPISFEVCSDNFTEMERQARVIASWGENVYAKIPVTTTSGEFCGPLIRRLSENGVRLNITALMTVAQVEHVAACLCDSVPACVSVFAGRVADTGRDPVPLMIEALRALQAQPTAELIWASPRELLNIFQADAIGCHIITVTHDLLAKLPLVGKDLDEFSLETVKMFHCDAEHAGYSF